MPKKGNLLRKQFCSLVVAGATLVGLYGCNSSPPTTQPPDTIQQPVVVQPDTGKAITPTPKPTAMSVALGEIRGRKYIDQDGNRQYGTSDKPVSGWDIRLYPASAMQTNAWNAPLASTTTDTSGNFSFTGLQSGTYVVASAPTGKNGERLQQVTPLDTAQAKSITLPQQANAYCEPTAYQVTLNTPCNPCDLSFIDYGTGYGGYAGYGGYGGYAPYGYPGYLGLYQPLIPVITVVDEEDEICDVDPIPLQTASGFAILAGTAVTNTGTTIVTGDVGVSPGSTLQGDSPTVYGNIFLADTTASQAKNDLTNAILNGFGRTCSETIRDGNLTGRTLLPGVYDAADSTLTLDSNGTLTLDANGCGSDAVWIFRASANLQVGSSARVVLANGAKASNVFWVVGNTASIGAGSIFVGSILAQQSIVLENGVNLQGRALALVSSVTLDTDIINIPCQ